MPATVSDEALRLGRVVYNFLQLGHEPIPADIIVALGTNDLRVAEFAASLYHRGYGAELLCTGGIAHQGDLLATPWDTSEAEMYADVAVEHGVPRDRILLETRATNTAENIRFARDIILSRSKRPRNIVFAVKPFMQRRTWATHAVEWPEMPATLASPAIPFEEYFTPELPPDKIIHIMMGDLQRVWIYAARGWSAPQRIPEPVREAFHRLAELGFTKQLIPESP